MDGFSSITAICVDTLNHELALEACARMARHGFAEVVLVTDDRVDEHLERKTIPGLRLEKISPLQGRRGYSNYVLRHLARHVRTAHALIFQWDGWVIDAAEWRPEFLDYDYVGGLFPWNLGPDRHARRVGNGGFCLRSARLMTLVATTLGADPDCSEDIFICDQLGDELERAHRIRFAPPELAMHFSVDQMSLPGYRMREPRLVADRTFGFHGVLNFTLVYDDEELFDLVDHRLGHFRDTFLRSTPAGMLLVNLTAAGRGAAAESLARRMAPLLALDANTATPKMVVERCQFNDVH